MIIFFVIGVYIFKLGFYPVLKKRNIRLVVILLIPQQLWNFLAYFQIFVLEDLDFIIFVGNIAAHIGQDKKFKIILYFTKLIEKYNY